MPTKNVRPLRKDTPNSAILAAIRKNASSAYKSRVPDPTKGDIQDSIRSMMTNTPDRNEFVSALVNRIGMDVARYKQFTNPLAKFKIGQLEYGDTIEEYMTGLATAHTYDSDREYLEEAIFGQERPEAQSNFHKINRENFYKVTVNDAILKRAFTSPSGLAGFVTQLMNSATTSDNWDEFLLTAKLFSEYEKNDGFFKVNVADVSGKGSDSSDARYMLRRVREMADTLPFLSRNYNAAGMPVNANADELELIITPEANAAMDVEALAGAFNIERAAMPTRQTVIPQEYLGIEGVQAILTTREFFVIADSLYETREAANPVGLHQNFFLHHHQVVSASRFVPAVMFTTGAGDRIEISDVPVTGVEDIVITDRDGTAVEAVERGNLYNVAGAAISDQDGVVEESVRLVLTGALSPQSYLTQTGVLHIAPNDEAQSVKVRATSTEDAAFTKTVTVAVTGDLLVLWPSPAVYGDADDDSIPEVTPKEPEFDKPAKKITIPSQEHVIYKDGTKTVSGVVNITAAKTITATAGDGFELAPGATVTWTFTP